VILRGIFMGPVRTLGVDSRKALKAI